MNDPELAAQPDEAPTRCENFLGGRRDLAAAGVKRISVGSWLARLAMGTFVRAARDMATHGTFGFGELEAFFAD